MKSAQYNSIQSLKLPQNPENTLKFPLKTPSNPINSHKILLKPHQIPQNPKSPYKIS
jgi:hypothetical protein